MCTFSMLYTKILNQLMSVPLVIVCFDFVSGNIENLGKTHQVCIICAYYWQMLSLTLIRGSIIVLRLCGFSHILRSDFGYIQLFCTVCG